MKLDLSLVVCVANDTRVKKLLDSVNHYCEVVVVLNGATNQVKDILKEYNNTSMFSLKTVEIPDRNLSKARNVGTINATYDKVVFYDSDCIIVGDALKLFSEKLEEFLLVDGKVEFKGDTWQSRIIKPTREMGLPNYALCPSMGINKKILNLIGNHYFNEEIKWVEDTELNNRAFKSGVKVGTIDEITCIHDNLTLKQDLKSAYRYGSGVKKSAYRGLHKKRPTANWNLIWPIMKKRFISGIYYFFWNINYCFGYIFTKGK